MQLLSRHQLLSMDPETLRASAECHGLDLSECPDRELVDAFDEWLAAFRFLSEAGE